MLIKFRCPNCKQKYESEEEYLGQFIECPNCSHQFTVEKMEEILTALPVAEPIPTSEESKIKSYSHNKIKIIIAVSILLIGIVSGALVLYFSSDLYRYQTAKKQGIQFSSDYKILLQCNNTNITECIIPDGVTTIGNNAFNGCANLRSVTIPDSVTVIGNGAFYKCEALQNLIIPEGVTEIGDRAFTWCSNLQSVTIPNRITEIGEGVFSGCKKLQSVTIPNSVTVIGDNAFSGCASLQNVIIGNSVTTIGELAFASCKNLKKVRVPKNCEIDFFAFPDSCRVIGY